LLLFLLSGLFLLRLAHRKLSGLLLFHEPPRTQRSNQLNPRTLSHNGIGNVNANEPPKAASYCSVTNTAHFGAESADKHYSPNRFTPEPEKGPLKAAPENRNLARSCGKTKAEVAEPDIWIVPETKGAPEEVRIVVDPRTATNTTIIIGR
jgi:hypothetical protein